MTAKAAVVGDLLGVLDDIELAQKHGDLTGAFKSVADRLIGALEKAGLKGFGAEGDAFDPAHHEAVQFGTSAEVEAPTVTGVFRRGYEFKDRPLRAAVVVVTGPEHDAPQTHEWRCREHPRHPRGRGGRRAGPAGRRQGALRAGEQVGHGPDPGRDEPEASPAADGTARPRKPHGPCSS